MSQLKSILATRLGISAIWFCLVAAVTAFFVLDNATRIDRDELQKILQQEIIEEIQINDSQTYFSTADKKTYVIATKRLPTCQQITITLEPTNTSEAEQRAMQPICGIQLTFQDNILPKITTRTTLTTKLIIAAILLIIGWSFISVFFESKRYEREEESSAITNLNDEHSESMSLSIEPMHSHLKFSDVAGIKEAKEDLLEIIDYLKNPKKYQDLGIYLPKGVLLVGPPGVGKTMIAKAIAGESGVPFFYHSGSSFVQVYVGVGAQRVRELFARARACAPSIIFIDEIDAIGKARGADNHQEWETTLNELLIELDGFSDQSGVIVIGATNQVEVMDHALLRSGRFDRRIYVDLPDLKERVEILKVHLRHRAYELDLGEVAKVCVGFSGANIASLVNEAALNALRHNRSSITMQDIADTSHKVLFGKKRQNALSAQERYMLSIYNAAKGLSQYWFVSDFQKIMLIDTTMESAPNIQHDYHTKSSLIAQIKIALSGNIALEMEGIGSSTIAQNDIEKAKYIAKKMCEDYGMAERLLTDYEDMLEILESAKHEHTEFIVANKEYIAKIAAILSEQERISKEEIQAILGGNF